MVETSDSVQSKGQTDSSSKPEYLVAQSCCPGFLVIRGHSEMLTGKPGNESQEKAT